MPTSWPLEGMPTSWPLEGMPTSWPLEGMHRARGQPPAGCLSAAVCHGARVAAPCVCTLLQHSVPPLAAAYRGSSRGQGPAHRCAAGAGPKLAARMPPRSPARPPHPSPPATHPRRALPRSTLPSRGTPRTPSSIWTRLGGSLPGRWCTSRVMGYTITRGLWMCSPSIAMRRCTAGPPPYHVCSRRLASTQQWRAELGSQLPGRWPVPQRRASTPSALNPKQGLAPAREWDAGSRS
jgi:hypothetical protein